MKRRIMEILDGTSHDNASRILEWVITIVVLTNCAAVVLIRCMTFMKRTKIFFMNSNSGA